MVKQNCDAWGNVLTTTGSSANTIGINNPLRYRGYVYDTETKLYYLQSRYYNPEWGRFINADNYPATGQGLIGNNMFAYCGNNPVSNKDPSGDSFETVFDVISFLSSLSEVIENPYDLWAWASLSGDLVDMLIPFVGGLGESVKALSAAVDMADTLDDLHDATKAADQIDDMVDAYKVMPDDGLCFVAGTEILTQEGSKAIEDIQSGDLVWAWDEETGETALKKVVETYVNETDELTHIFVGGEEIVATPSHPFYSPVKGWTDACKLRAGDILVLVNGEYVVVEKVQHEILEAPVTVYNFQVADYHTYFIGNSKILVHNSCTKGPGFDDNQRAVIELSKEYKNGMSRQEAEILVEWANEYGISAHPPMTHPYRSGYWSEKLHIDIMKKHIAVFE